MRPQVSRRVLGVLPFLVLVGLYLMLSIQRHAVNPDDKLLPLPSQLFSALQRSFIPGSAGIGQEIPFVQDTLASLGRLAFGLLLSGSVSLALALLLANSVLLHNLFNPLLVFVAKVPPIALMPILLLWMGVNESSKAGLLLIGLVPYLTLHVLDRLEMNKRQVSAKLHTLNMRRWQQILFVDVPMIWPSFLQELQTSLGPAWLFLLVAETIGTNYGLGYRIFVVRRFLAMDTILVYVVWITLLSVGLYYLVGLWKRQFRWYFSE